MSESKCELTQNERILRHLRDYGSLTSMEAVQEYGIMRLASRVCELRRKGHQIRAINETGRNRYGERTSYARYVLGDI